MVRTILIGLAIFGLFCTSGVVQAQGKFNKKIKVGDPAPVYKDLPGIDGKKHALADVSGKDVVVVVFTCNHCPYAEDYEDRIVAFTKKHVTPESKVAVVAISVSLKEEDRLPKMVARAKEKKFNFPYMYDETQQIGRLYGSTVTPEFFVLNKARKIVYLGAMDDNTDPALVKINYLEAAVQAALKGELPATTETPAVGCSVEYERLKK